MKAIVLVLSLLFAAGAAAQAPDWILVSQTGRAEAGASFELLLIGPEHATLPDEIALRMKIGTSELDLRMQARSPQENGRRAYVGTMPAAAAGAAALELADPPSNVVVVLVTRRDAVQALSGLPASGEEPLMSEDEPMYFVVGARGGASARFQLSFKYRLFDYSSGFGREQPWLAGLYFGYTQNSLWDLSAESKPFRDTSYRPSLFWKWQRTDERTWIDAARLGIEHESNGRDDPYSRSIDILFVRPEWRWRTAGLGNFAFTPKIYAYLEKDDNPDIERYRGYVDWRVRYDSGDNWIATAVARYGTSGRGSLLVDLSRRTRDLKIGPLSGYLHAQYFNGYGEDILDYNVRRKAQLRLGFAIVP